VYSRILEFTQSEIPDQYRYDAQIYSPPHCDICCSDATSPSFFERETIAAGSPEFKNQFFYTKNVSKIQE